MRVEEMITKLEEGIDEIEDCPHAMDCACSWTYLACVKEVIEGLKRGIEMKRIDSKNESIVKQTVIYDERGCHHTRMYYYQDDGDDDDETKKHLIETGFHDCVTGKDHDNDTSDWLTEEEAKTMYQARLDDR